jgi:hypothetical protein
MTLRLAKPTGAWQKKGSVGEGRGAGVAVDRSRSIRPGRVRARPSRNDPALPPNQGSVL